MSANSNFSKIARNGSAISATSSNAGSVDSSSHNHIFSQIPPFSTWLQTMYTQNHRHESIATGAMRTGMAVLTREMMEMHVHQAPDVRGMLDCLPVAKKPNMEFIGWRQKLGTWPSTRRELSLPEVPQRRFTSV
ncbi:hypothetical protein ONS95_014911 [Cadophora gregata]|uniref:uncharacterized protein n=1 Tax=Cadophora gregata TaxID=51156 RepID=UPI0026DCDF0D|nr:uncharacterized protein ONS95_014911 [Cadophora gregata]KAK0113216.1 hypothetical protein ONS95_014911 [Cadophora gregata]KAK0125258.1 hypothetical protein ONS96_009113 [Cadophora gregata f. sp. sojae]